jgi:hypothetical protein
VACAMTRRCCWCNGPVPDRAPAALTGAPPIHVACCWPQAAISGPVPRSRASHRAAWGSSQRLIPACAGRRSVHANGRRSRRGSWRHHRRAGLMPGRAGWHQARHAHLRPFGKRLKIDPGRAVMRPERLHASRRRKKRWEAEIELGAQGSQRVPELPRFVRHVTDRAESYC